MDPKPDYGYDTYTGSGKLKGKVSNIEYLAQHVGRKPVYPATYHRLHVHSSSKASKLQETNLAFH